MDDTRRLVLSILYFFDEQQRSPDLSPDAIESLEVASQCLESAYKISIRDVDAIAQCDLPAPLPQIFSTGLNHLTSPTACDKVLAEKLKAEGNEYMKQDLYDKAIISYTEAIKNDSRNAVYYCNRAAAYGKLGNHTKSIEDCQSAISIDPTYAKAYGRKGLAHSAMNQHQQAKNCYKKASELDPMNESYKDNLKMAEQSVRSETMNQGAGPTPGMGLGGLNLGGMDLSSFLNNPMLMNMATTMLSNPQMQSMMANMMSGLGGGGAGGPETGEEGFGGGGGTGGPDAAGNTGPGITRLLEVGQQFAQQIQQTNPDLIEQLRTQMNTSGSSANPATNNPPNNNQNNSEGENGGGS